MKRLFQKLEAALTAVAFAEEGEVAFARQIMAEAGIGVAGAPSVKQNFESTMMAAAFAEEGDAETARRIMAEAGMGRTAAPHAGQADSQSGSPRHSEGVVMAHETKKKPIGAMAATGVVSAALYAALLLHQDEVNSIFGRAGAYAVLPILTAFLFSVVHGTFTGHFWTVLGVEAAKNHGKAH